jgi:hypothetical protein
VVLLTLKFERIKINHSTSANLLSTSLSSSATRTSSCLLPAVVAVYSLSKMEQRTVASSKRVLFL